MLDEAWLRAHGYQLVGDRAIRQPQPTSNQRSEGIIVKDYNVQPPAGAPHG
jgi:hypothetical protein